MNWIRGNKGRPFFLYFAVSVPHAALQVPDDELEPYIGAWDEEPLNDGQYTPHPRPRAARAGMISRMDRDIGKVLNALAEHDLTNNTLVVFASDNGPGSEGGADLAFFNSTGGLRGQKRDLYEGGIRVPMIVRWPNVIKPDQRTAHISAMWDILPTFAELAGQSPNSDVDGISMVPLFRGEEQQVHQYLYWEFHSGSKSAIGDVVSAQAVRMGDWKGVRKRTADYDRLRSMELYDLSSDRGEQQNIASEHPSIVERIAEIMDQRTPSDLDDWNF